MSSLRLVKRKLQTINFARSSFRLSSLRSPLNLKSALNLQGGKWQEQRARCFGQCNKAVMPVKRGGGFVFRVHQQSVGGNFRTGRAGQSIREQRAAQALALERF